MMTANEKRTQQQKIQQQKERERDILILKKRSNFLLKKKKENTYTYARAKRARTRERFSSSRSSGVKKRRRRIIIIMASSSFTSSSNSSLVSIVKALSCLLFLSFSSVFLGVTADTLSKNVSSSAARKRDASSSSSSSAAARKREEDARVVDQLAANLMMNAGARMQNEKTPRNNGTFASSTSGANTGDTLDANNYASKQRNFCIFFDQRREYWQYLGRFFSRSNSSRR
jgi:hypothetical protein